MLEPILAGLIGLLIGSFLNVCIYRLPRDLSVVRPRSHCPACKAPIAWYDNIPLYSYLALRGRCRQCGKPISYRYPLVEFLTAALFFFIVLQHSAGLLAVKLCVFSTLLVGLTFSDLEQRILPDELTLGGAAAGVVFSLFEPIRMGYIHALPLDWDERWLSLTESLAGVFIGGGILWLVAAIYSKIRRREGLGFGDIKMIAMIGAFLGILGALRTLIFGSLLGSVFGLLYIKLAGKDYSTYELPFGTFLGITALGLALLSAGS